MTKQPPSQVKPHLFVPDPDLAPHPKDIETRGVCLTCHLLGEPGDPRHTLPDVPEQALVASRYEHENGDER